MFIAHIENIAKLYESEYIRDVFNVYKRLTLCEKQYNLDV